jgi:molybdopterin/thiamine biosynthesis adenylyltransferase
MVSGGAIAHAALYALSRIPGVEGHARVIEAEASDLTNMNRYAFLRRSRVGEAKADHLASLELGELTITSIPLRYEERTLSMIGPLAPCVLVGVDHVPSRWAVQRTRPQWLGIGATNEYLVQATYHVPGLPCARCLHQDGSDVPAEIPTAAFVSHWAGLWLASMFARRASGERIGPGQQQLHMATLRPDLNTSIWRTPGVAIKGCELRCPL